MLLRDQDLRGLNISDLFNIQQQHPVKGSSLASGLVFCISHDRKEPVPDFSDTSDWYKVKLFVGSGESTNALSVNTQRLSYSAIMLACE
ncbi:hypothetical protein BGW38_008966, partial [Lunasporangiospora selenospora]